MNAINTNLTADAVVMPARTKGGGGT